MLVVQNGRCFAENGERFHQACFESWTVADKRKAGRAIPAWHKRLPEGPPILLGAVRPHRAKPQKSPLLLSRKCAAPTPSGFEGTYANLSSKGLSGSLRCGGQRSNT